MVKYYTTYARYAYLDISYKLNNKDYFVIGFYCPAKVAEKKLIVEPFWNILEQFNPSFLVGDFSEMIRLQDKIGGRPSNLSQIYRFPNLISIRRLLIFIVCKMLTLRKTTNITILFIANCIERLATLPFW